MERKRDVESGYAGLNGVMGSWNLELKGRLRLKAFARYVRSRIR